MLERKVTKAMGSIHISLLVENGTKSEMRKFIKFATKEGVICWNVCDIHSAMKSVYAHDIWELDDELPEDY